MSRCAKQKKGRLPSEDSGQPITNKRSCFNQACLVWLGSIASKGRTFWFDGFGCIGIGRLVATKLPALRFVECCFKLFDGDLTIAVAIDSIEPVFHFLGSFVQRKDAIIVFVKTLDQLGWIK